MSNGSANKSEVIEMDKKTLVNYMGLFGIAAFLSYIAAMVFAPGAYPGYNWRSQAISDLSAVNAPSRDLWGQLAALHNAFTLPCMFAVCIFIRGKLNKPLRVGIYLFTLMSCISKVGYDMFPLSDSGNAGEIQDIMHVYVVTPLVVMLSIASLITIMIGGYRSKGEYRALAVCATVSLGMMFAGPIGMAALPKAYFGIFERFSVLAATGFTAVLGIALFRGFGEKE